jgi:hypothetical protein
MPSNFSDFPEQKVDLVHAVYGPIRWNCGASDFRQSRERVGFVHNVVADTACRNVARPADDEGRSERALHMREIIAAPRARRSLPRPGRLRAVVAGEDNDGVAANA